MAGVLRLPDWLRREARRGFAWGEADCCTLACDWVLAVTGIDPMAHGRGRYRSARGAARILKRGGLVPAAAAALDRHFARTALPAAGDIVLISNPAGHLLGIALGPLRAALRARDGLWSGPVEPIIAWSLNCPSS